MKKEQPEIMFELLKDYISKQSVIKVTVEGGQYFFGVIKEINNNSILLKNDKEEKYAIVKLNEIVQLHEICEVNENGGRN